MRWLECISDSVDMILSKLWEIVKDRKAWCAFLNPILWGCKKSEKTERLDSNISELSIILKFTSKWKLFKICILNKAK